MEEVQQVESAVAPSEQPANNLFTQEQLNKIIGREKSKAAEAARREVEARYQQGHPEAGRTEAAPQSDAAQQFEELYARKQAEQQAKEAELKKNLEQEQLRKDMDSVAQTYTQKVGDGKKHYEDYDEVTKDFDPTAVLPLTFLLTHLDNPADVIYELSKNSNKHAAIGWLAERNPRQAHAELLKLSKSIVSNRQAQQDAQTQTVPDPLDRLSPSRIANSNTKPTIKDLRNQDWLRG